LVLNDVDYATITHQAVTLTARLVQPPLVNPAIKDNTPQRKLLHLQADMKNHQKAFDLQEAITNIGVQCIINIIEEQYVKEFNEDYFGYANQTIKSLLEHLCTNWCKVMTKECMDATKAFCHTWVPSSTHVITFGCQLTKLQKKCRTINIIISDKAKALHFFGQMYKRDYFTEDQMTKYEMQTDAEKEWDPTINHFSKLFAQRKTYSNNRAANSGFESAATMFNVPSDRTFATSKSNGNFTAPDLYIKSLEESLALACNYMTNAPTTAPAPTPVVDPMSTLHLDMDAKHKLLELLLKHLQRRVQVPTPAVVPPQNQGSLVANGRGHTSRSAPTARKCAPINRMIVTPWQQMRTNTPPTIRHPCQPDRSRGPTLILI
jgi:hypothetical protein